MRKTSLLDRRGSSLPVVLVTCFIITGVATIAISLSLFRYRIVNRSLAMEQAFSVAEGGAERVIARIAKAVTSGGVAPAASGAGTINGYPYTYRYVGDSVESVGTVRGVSRKVTVHGLARGYWRRWLYFADYFNIPDSYGNPRTPIWFITGDYLDGPVHCNHDMYINGSPVFIDEVSLVGNIVEGGGYDPVFSNASSPQYVNTIDLQSIDFDQLYDNANNFGLCFVGETDITLNDDTMTVINSGTTNTYTIGSGSNIIYVSDGSVPVGGTGHWEDRVVTNTISYWEPSYTVTNTTEGQWAPGTSQGGYQPPSGWYNQGGMTYKYYAFSFFRWTFRYRESNGDTGYADDWQSRYVPELISYDGDEPDYKVDAHTEYDAKAKSSFSWDLAYVSTHYRYEWIPGSNVVVTVGSNLVEIVTNYTEQVWIESTNVTENVNGDVHIRGQMSAGLTVVADRHITVTGDLTYTNKSGEPVYTDPASDVMCGLITGGDVIVANDNPYQVEDRTIHASIMATGAKTGSDEGDPHDLDGRFIVEDYNRGTHKGTLNVYGGIIQNWRGPVGTFGSGGPRTGFLKNYVYDIRFSDAYHKAPPACPLINVQFNFERWEEGPGT